MQPSDPPQALSLRSVTMEHKGVEYTVVQMVDRTAGVRFGGGKNKSSVTPRGRAAAIKMAEYEIDRVVKDRS